VGALGPQLRLTFSVGQIFTEQQEENTLAVRIRTVLGTAALTVTAVVGLASTATAAPTQPASVRSENCWPHGSGYLCNNITPLPIEWAGRIVGHVTTDPSWFKCRYEGDLTGGGGPHPNRWLYTIADDTSAWGFAPDYAISSETNPLPKC
jgi:hypothetical protein